MPDAVVLMEINSEHIIMFFNVIMMLKFVIADICQMKFKAKQQNPSLFV